MSVYGVNNTKHSQKVSFWVCGNEFLGFGMSFTVSEMSFTVSEMSFPILAEMSFGKNAQKKACQRCFRLYC